MTEVMAFSWVLAGVALIYSGMIGFFSVYLFRGIKAERGTVPSGQPFVSVVIAARNEEARIEGCLADLAGQDYPRDRFEVLVCDDFSEDRTAELIRAFFLSHPGIRGGIVEPGSSGSGKKAALTRAVDAASGEYILVTDADTRRGSSWITVMAGEARGGDRVMVLGPVLLDSANRPLERMQSAEFLGIMGITAGSAVARMPVMCNGANLLYRKDFFDEAGGYAGNRAYASGDDQFLMESAKRIYGRDAISFAADSRATVIATAQETLKSFLDQRRRWVSKSRGYRDPAILATGAVTFLMNLALIAGLVAAIRFPILFRGLFFAFCLKAIADFLPVLRMALFFRKKEYLLWYLPAQLFQPVYVLAAGVLGLVLPYRWKGRVMKA